jgi:hypothetical protein
MASLQRGVGTEALPTLHVISILNKIIFIQNVKKYYAAALMTYYHPQLAKLPLVDRIQQN